MSRTISAQLECPNRSDWPTDGQPISLCHRLMGSYSTDHQAQFGPQGWSVSFLPGRSFTHAETQLALEAAEASARISALARLVGLTALELTAMATNSSTAQGGGQ
ncbi:hypothetical protein ACFXNW_18360 [Nocardia sp. NPDC059180]|uniref:hypothetical protein n=1 Tax=Nocardia sp. NPDC059180 TaxID=3346761 RepID=UPI0036C479F1